jgi:hypothetical protein
VERANGVVYQRGQKVRWWMWGSGLACGRHAHHLHAPGRCGADRETLLEFPALNVAADGSFYQEGTTRSARRVVSGAANFWTIHDRGPAPRGDAVVGCATRSGR